MATVAPDPDLKYLPYCFKVVSCHLFSSHPCSTSLVSCNILYVCTLCPLPSYHSLAQPRVSFNSSFSCQHNLMLFLSFLALATTTTLHNLRIGQLSLAFTELYSDTRSLFAHLSSFFPPHPLFNRSFWLNFAVLFSTTFFNLAVLFSTTFFNLSPCSLFSLLLFVVHFQFALLLWYFVDYCSRSRRRVANGSKRMYLDYTHGLFIT